MSCKGVAFLRKALEAAQTKVRETGATPVIAVYDGEEWTKFDNALTAAQEAKEIDGEVRYRVFGKEWTLAKRGKTYVFAVIYDRPYDADNCAEIIYDYNEAGGEIIEAADW